MQMFPHSRCVFIGAALILLMLVPHTPVAAGSLSQNDAERLLAQQETTSSSLTPPEKRPSFFHSISKFFSVDSAESEQKTPDESVKQETGEGVTVAEAPVKHNAPLPGRKPFYAKGPMSDDQAELYSQIFVLQEAGKLDEADTYIQRLRDPRLMGYVLFQRYMHPTAYRSSFAELRSWLDRYADQPGADRIYRLATKRKPDDFKGRLVRPDVKTFRQRYLPALRERTQSFEIAAPIVPGNKAARSLKNRISMDLRADNPQAAYESLIQKNNRNILKPQEYDDLQAKIARAFMQTGDSQTAFRLASESFERSGVQVPVAGWIAGLSGWHLGRYQEAFRYFARTSESPYASGWTLSAASYWAARAALRAGEIESARPYLEKAAQEPRTFYGLIATRALGWDFDFNWQAPSLTKERKDELETYAGGQRAQALIKAGRYRWAEEELLALYDSKDKDFTRALMAVAYSGQLPSLALKLGTAHARPDGGFYDFALFPLMPWEPEEGYVVDRALLHAFIRQESRFDPEAKSPSGATGLMQLMPITAYHVTGNRYYKNANGHRDLENPRINLEIGQLYIHDLLKSETVDNNLFSLAIAYNAGPGNLRRWQSQLNDIQNDPLLFVESIPVSETRAFVERVLANYWIYRLRLGQPTPSLDAVAAGGWAFYSQLEYPAANIPEIRPSTKPANPSEDQTG